MAINPIGLFSVYQKNSVNLTGQEKPNQNDSLISFNQDQLQADSFVRQNNNFETSPSGKMISKNDKEKMRAREDEVRRHEQAHQAAGGAFAGSPSYEYNEYGYIQNGHVNISMPSVNKENPELSKSQAEIVKKSALAPSGFSELSDADLSVAAQAESIISESDKLINEKRDEKNQTSTNPFA